MLAVIHAEVLAIPRTPSVPEALSVHVLHYVVATILYPLYLASLAGPASSLTQLAVVNPGANLGLDHNHLLRP